MEKIELSDKKIIKGAITIWNEHGQADLLMDMKNLSFRPDSVGEIYTFHVLDHLYPEEIESTFKNWFNCLRPGGKLFVIVDNFEYVARGYVGGDLSIEVVNQVHNHPMQFCQDSLTKAFMKAGFRDIVEWFNGLPGEYDKKHYELVLAGIK